MLDRIVHESEGNLSFMEVCGTHTVAISKFGIRSSLRDRVKLVSGPGCPVCVVPGSVIDSIICLSRKERFTVATFGDMMRVPAHGSSLQAEKARGADIQVVYSPMDALNVARRKGEKKVVFFAVGFETTAPAVAATVLEAERQGLRNFFILSAHRLIPPAVEMILDLGEVNLDGLMLPGHVSTVIGSLPYQNLVVKHRVPAVITGFEPADILQGIHMLITQVLQHSPRLETQYTRSVRPEGNPRALELMSLVFDVVDSSWRGLGKIDLSGLVLKTEHADMDAGQFIGERVDEGDDQPKACRCSEVLRAVCEPLECPLFGEACTPEHPVGPCMVSSEGTCAAWYRYEV